MFCQKTEPPRLMPTKSADTVFHDRIATHSSSPSTPPPFYFRKQQEGKKTQCHLTEHLSGMVSSMDDIGRGRRVPGCLRATSRKPSHMAAIAFLMSLLQSPLSVHARPVSRMQHQPQRRACTGSISRSPSSASSRQHGSPPLQVSPHLP